MKNKVTLIKDHLLKKLRERVKVEIKDRFKEGDRVCIKTHMGEYGNLFYVRPPAIELVVDELKKVGAEPFVFDSPTVYPGSRDSAENYLETARKNGFTEGTMGCPIIVSNEGVEVESKYFSKVKLSKQVVEADGLVVVSHFKGHEQTCFGGAIKNIGMGCIDKGTKGIMHTETQVEIDDIEKCTGCGACVAGCPEETMSLVDNKVKINYDACFGCCACALVLCQYGVLKPKTVSLSEGIAEVAGLVLKELDKNKTLFMNVLMDITDYCDCLPIGDADVGAIKSPNIGIVVANNATVIDKASLDLVDQATDGKFGEIWPADKNWQIEYGEKYGLRNREYELVEI